MKIKDKIQVGGDCSEFDSLESASSANRKKKTKVENNNSSKNTKLDNKTKLESIGSSTPPIPENK